MPAACAPWRESSSMKTNITRFGAALVAVGICIWSTHALAQANTTVTTTKGAFTEYVPGSQTVVVRTEANPTPLHYSVTKQTTIVDESGAPVPIEHIPPDSQLSIQYTGIGEQQVASRIIVQRPASATAPVPTALAPAERQITTTTSTTHALTHEEKEALKKQKEERKEQLEEQIEKQKDALDRAKDKLEDDDD